MTQMNDEFHNFYLNNLFIQNQLTSPNSTGQTSEMVGH